MRFAIFGVFNGSLTRTYQNDTFICPMIRGKFGRNLQFFYESTIVLSSIANIKYKFALLVEKFETYNN